MSNDTSNDNKQILRMLKSLPVVSYQQLPNNLKRIAIEIDKRNEQLSSDSSDGPNLAGQQLIKLLTPNK